MKTLENRNNLEIEELEGLNRLHQEIRELSVIAEQKLARSEYGSQELQRLRSIMALQLEQAAALPAALSWYAGMN